MVLDNKVIEMSLDQDNMNEKQSKDKGASGVTRSRLDLADVEASYIAAQQKKMLGIPLDEKDETALKAGKVIQDLKDGK